jgi:hypothetical protein
MLRQTHGFQGGRIRRRKTDSAIRGRGDDLYAIANDIEFLKVQRARLPRRKGLVRMALGIIFRSTALVLIARGVAPV